MVKHLKFTKYMAGIVLLAISVAQTDVTSILAFFGGMLVYSASKDIIK